MTNGERMHTLGKMQASERNGVGYATLRLTTGMPEVEPREYCERSLEDPAVRCVVLEARGATAAHGGAWMLRFPRPLIFAFDGTTAPGLAEIATGADIRVCSPDAAMTLPSHPSPWLRSRIKQLSNAAPAFGATIPSRIMLDLGLVSRVAVHPALEAGRLAATVASRGPIATELGKEAVWRGIEMPLEQALRLETDLTLLLQTTKDRAEGVRAFLEKRSPRFTGD